MKKLLLTSAVIISAGAAQAAVTPYVSLKAGYMDNAAEAFIPGMPVDVSQKIYGFGGFVGSVAGGLGFEVDPLVTLRGELEYSYARTTLTVIGETLALNANSIMANGYADFGAASWAVKPYVGFGLGYSFGSASNLLGIGTDIDGEGGFAYAYMIGAAWYINSHFALDASVKRWVNNGGITVGGTTIDTKYTGTSYMVGARYSF